MNIDNQITDPYFVKIKEKSNFLSDYFVNILKNTNKINHDVYMGFEVEYCIERDIWKKEEIFKKINKLFPIANIGILKMNPNTSYLWHCDTDRTVGINLLLSGFDHSFCVFEKLKSKTVSEIQKETITLNYEPNTFFLFNTKIPHTVFNFDKPRYLLSLQFKQNDILTYHIIKDIFKEEGIIL